MLPDLKSIYIELLEALPWPKPLPTPNEIILLWNPRLTSTLGRCHGTKNRIDVNLAYAENEKLRSAIKYLLAHEAAHFIWPNHGRDFKAFLRENGVPEPYVRARGLPIPIAS
jgi:hypothetical protein